MAASGQPRIEDRVAGISDGVNTLFQTAQAYRAGTLVAFRNGQALERTKNNGYIELGGKLFRMKEPPLPQDVVGAYYVVE